MQTRFIIKTHTECLRPQLYFLLLLKCTAPDTATSRARAQTCMREVFSSEGQRRDAAVRFAISIAERHLNLVRSNLTWEWRGFALTAVLRQCGRSAESSFRALADLADQERILFLKYLLEADGALLALFCREIVRSGPLSHLDLYGLYDQMVDRLYSEYESAALDFRAKTVIRDRKLETQRQTTGNQRDRATLPHKVLPHLQALIDLGVLTRMPDGKYAAQEFGGKPNIGYLAEQTPQLLDRMVEERQLFHMIATLLLMEIKAFSPDDSDNAKKALLDGYYHMRDEATGTAHISAMVDFSCAEMLGRYRVLMHPAQADQLLLEMQRLSPDSVRFHVDFSGEPAYIVMSDR